LREIVTHPDRSGEAALRHAAWLRLAHGWRSLGGVLQAQILLGAVGLPALLADHAQHYFTASGPGPDPLVPWIVRVVALLTLMLGLLLARLGPSLFLRAADETFLAVTPLSGAARFRYRAWQLGMMALPAAWLGGGALVPLLWNGDAGLFVRALALWISGAALAWAWCAAVSSLAPPPGRGQAAFELAVGAAPAGLLLGVRALTGFLMPLAARDSLWLTAALGLALAALTVTAAARSAWLHASREHALEAMRGRGDRRRGAGMPARAPDVGARVERTARGGPAGRALPRWGRGALALVQRDVWIATRSPRVGGPWLAGILLKALGFASVLVPAAIEDGRPWALAGASLLLGDAMFGGAVIAQMGFELPNLFFGAPLSHARRWWATAGPALLVSCLATLALAGVAWAAPDGGHETARFILSWCGLTGLSLIVTAVNLALAAFPEVSVAQNLFWVGLLVCLILSAVIPLFGWVVLVAFALYSFRQLRHWGPA
jgi:hypothetical protein